MRISIPTGWTTRYVIEVSGGREHDERLWKRWHPAGRRYVRKENKWHRDYAKRLAERKAATAHLRTRSQWIGHLRDHTEDTHLFEMWAREHKQELWNKYSEVA